MGFWVKTSYSPQHLPRYHVRIVLHTCIVSAAAYPAYFPSITHHTLFVLERHRLCKAVENPNRRWLCNSIQNACCRSICQVNIANPAAHTLHAPEREGPTDKNGKERGAMTQRGILSPRRQDATTTPFRLGVSDNDPVVIPESPGTVHVSECAPSAMLRSSLD